MRSENLNKREEMSMEFEVRFNNKHTVDELRKANRYGLLYKTLLTQVVVVVEGKRFDFQSAIDHTTFYKGRRFANQIAREVRSVISQFLLEEGLENH